jgi:hypothetical protein
MSLSRIDSPDRDFAELIHDPDLHSRYTKELKNNVSKIEKHFETEKIGIEGQLRAGLTDDDEHRQILNACVYPFCTGQIPRYRFICAAPLVELDQEERIKNLDFMIACLEPEVGESRIAIMGEAKGPLSTNASDRVVQEMKERIGIVDAHWKQIQDRYLGGEEFQKEFVLGVDSFDANEVAKSVANKGGNIIIWSVDRFTPQLRLLRHTAEKQIQKSMMHTNRGLTNLLSNKLPTSLQYKIFYLQSHPVVKLRILTGIDKALSKKTFTIDDVRPGVEETLDYVKDNEIIERETNMVVKVAKEIGFLDDEGDGNYKITGKHKNASGRERRILKLWIDSELQVRLDQRKVKEKATLQELYLKERQKYPRLEDLMKRNVVKA